MTRETRGLRRRCCRSSPGSRRTGCRGASSPTRRRASPRRSSPSLGLARRAPRRSSAATPPRIRQAASGAAARGGARGWASRPSDCVYVGDDLRDVEAGRAAAMATVVAAWGYLGDGDAPAAWGADHLIERPERAAAPDRRPLEARGRCPKLALLGLTWLRRGFGVGTVHAEHQFARKSTGNKVTANDSSYALAA